MIESSPPTGTILHLQRLSTEDGPGLRTTVFYKGCPLHCQWCHNPESISPRLQVQWLAVRCIGCNSCLEVCPQGCLTHTSAGILRDRALCTVCGECAAACPTGAMELLGKKTTVEELALELNKDRVYFEKNGGVTLSGGEPTLQPAFTLALVSRLKELELNVALDTCLLCQKETLEQLYPLVDTFLVDVKLIAPQEHQKWTGAPLAPILANLSWLASRLRQPGQGKRLWIRTPLIPGATNAEENLSGISAFLAAELPEVVERWELCAFNNLCRDKYSRLDLDWEFQATPLMTLAEFDQAKAWARVGGFDSQRIFVTGSARTPEN